MCFQRQLVHTVKNRHDAAGVRLKSTYTYRVIGTVWLKQTKVDRLCTVGTVVKFFPFYTCSYCLSLIWPPLSFLILSFSALHPPNPPPHPTFSSHLPSSFTTLFWFRRTGYVCSPCNETMEPPLLPPSPFLLTIFIICSYIVCLPVCLPVSFSVPHTSVWQPVVSNKKKIIIKTNERRHPGDGSSADGICSRLLMGIRERGQYCPYFSHPSVTYI